MKYRSQQLTLIRNSLAFLLSACLSLQLSAAAPTPTAKRLQASCASNEKLSAAAAQQLLARRARLALRAIKNQDATTLATLVHPDKGLRFSPYGEIRIEKERRLTSPQVQALFTNNKRYKWGEEDASGEDIRLSARQYFKQWVYDRDFLNAPQVFYNQIVFGGTTMICNVAEVYPQAVFVTFHFPSSDGGMDWTSLCLGFEEKNGKWYLVSLVHNVWAI